MCTSLKVVVPSHVLLATERKGRKAACLFGYKDIQSILMTFNYHSMIAHWMWSMMRWYIAYEARSAEVAIITSYPISTNGIIILVHTSRLKHYGKHLLLLLCNLKLSTARIAAFELHSFVRLNKFMPKFMASFVASGTALSQRCCIPEGDNFPCFFSGILPDKS